jgi:vancomycin resistance protein VanW
VLKGVDPTFQYNKVNNLKLACAKVNGIILKPGQKFSFWKLVGEPTEKKGYLPGLVLSGGEAVCGIGGGLCQMANILHWMALHSPLDVIERHHHSFDMFPDSGRVIPFGTGASLFYNYIDFGLQNKTKNTFQILMWVDDKYLHGEIRSQKPVPVSYHISERDHAFVKDITSGKHFRKNAIWRKTVSKKTGKTVSENELFRNFSETKYTPADVL